MKYYRKESGITLLALIITIIVLLILTGVVINTVIGNGSLFVNTQKAVKANNEGVNDEKTKLDSINDFVEENYERYKN